MSSLVETVFGSGQDLDTLQMAARAGLVFVFALAMIRVSGRRSFGQHRPFDACATVLLGAVLSRAVVGASPFWPTMAAGGTIVLLHRGIAMASLRWPAFESLVSGDKRDLVVDGRRNPEQMAKGLITLRDLEEAIRRKLGDEKCAIRSAVLERDGEVTIDAADSDRS